MATPFPVPKTTQAPFLTVNTPTGLAINQTLPKGYYHWHNYRDTINNNVTIVEHLRLMNGADIRAEQPQVQYATAATGNTIAVSMNGIFILNNTTSGATVITVQAPFVNASNYPISLLSQPPGSGAVTFSSIGNGTFTINVGGGSNIGVYSISIGPTNLPTNLIY